MKRNLKQWAVRKIDRRDFNKINKIFQIFLKNKLKYFGTLLKRIWGLLLETNACNINQLYLKGVEIPLKMHFLLKISKSLK